MSAPTHDSFTLQLSDYLDGDLDRADAEALDAHLSECATCRGILADLREIVAQARALGGVEPSRDLWPDIARAIVSAPPEEEGARVIAFPGSTTRVRGRGLFFTVPQIAAAAVVLVSVSVGATWWAGMGPASSAATPLPASGQSVVSVVDDAGAPPPDLAREIASLEAILREARERLDPNTARILEKNLGVIQRAIDESRQALAVDPANPFLRDHLERTYREKADFLREVATIAAWEG